MSNLDSEIEDAIKAKLEADAWVQANVTTIETDIREALLVSWDFSEAYNLTELPAVSVAAGLSHGSSEQTTTNELTHRVPVTLVGVLSKTGKRSIRKKAARNAAQEMAGQLERILNGCRTSMTALAVTGRGNTIKEVTHEIELYEVEPHYYGVVKIEASVVVMRDI